MNEEMRKHCFIVGSPRSGTTLLNSLLIQHPKILGGAETHLLPMIEKILRQYQSHEGLNQVQIGLHHWISEDALRRVSADFFKALTFEQSKSGRNVETVYLEKTPSNAYLIPTIDSLFSDYLVIHVIRDPLDVCDSIHRASTGWGARWAPSKLSQIVKIWTGSVRKACRDGRPRTENYMEIYYHDLINNTESILHRVFEKLDLELDADTIKRCIDMGQQVEGLPDGFIASKACQSNSLNLWQRFWVRLKVRATVRRYELNF